ncbi:TolC family protein [Pendulispora rubella]|uniref:TolC family protein n=1 Tax=Pendulispora rubella TaxID=2741070 RepID=A0ABZ2LI79_9BACT
MTSFQRIQRVIAQRSFTLNMTPSPWFVVLPASIALVAFALTVTRSACADGTKLRPYSLGECLRLAEKNHPAIDAARARLASMRAQIDEARAAPWSFVNLSSRFGGVPNRPSDKKPEEPSTLADGIGPFLQLGVNATVPLYTFGKIASAKRAAEAQARLGEWDVEKEKLQVRTDVRRAFFGVALARDMLQLASDALMKLNEAIGSIVAKLESGDTSVENADRLRLEVSRDELLARVADAKRGETAGLAALRFYTGVQSGFDVPDEPLAPPPTPLGPVIRYLVAARLNRPDVNRARAGAVARDAQVDIARANLFPNIGLGMLFDYAIAPNVKSSPSGREFNPNGAANHLQFGAALGLEWSLDFATKAARLQQAKSNLAEAYALERLALGGVATEVEVAHAAAVEANERAERWERAVHRAKGWIVEVENAIDLGTKDGRALLEPLRILISARANYNQGLMDQNMTRTELARVSGADEVGSAAP